MNIEFVIAETIILIFTALLSWFFGSHRFRGKLIRAVEQSSQRAEQIEVLNVEIANITAGLDSLRREKQDYEIAIGKVETQLENEAAKILEREHQLREANEKYQLLEKKLEEKGQLLQDAKKAEGEAKQLTQQLSQLNSKQLELGQKLEAEQQQLKQVIKQAEGERVRANDAEQSIDELRGEKSSLIDQKNSLRIRCEEAEKTVQELQTRLEEQQKQNLESKQQLEESKLALKAEFQNLANEILESKGKAFAEQHKERLDALLKPFKEQLGEFRDKVEEARKEDSAGRAALKQQLETLHSLNIKITNEAENLTKALKGDKKLQGCWGELQVEKILESSGLIKGQEYDREPNFKDEVGQNKRPDFIVYLPEGKHLVIDSKVSLVDYFDHVNAETENARGRALTNHVKSVRNHIQGLHQKDYSGLPGLNAPDFVFMFMPIEPAFMVAFQHDQKLFNEAFEKRIVVVTPTTLLATLRTVANLWTIERQNANARKLADRASKVYDKLQVFVGKMEKLDGQLVSMRGTYDDALNTLKQGRGNLVSQAQQFLDLGVRVKKALPRHTLETADLGSEIQIEPLGEGAL